MFINRAVEPVCPSVIVGQDENWPFGPCLQQLAILH